MLVGLNIPNNETQCCRYNGRFSQEEAPSAWCNVCCYKYTAQTWGQEELDSRDVNIKLNTLDLPNPAETGVDCSPSREGKVGNPMGHQR